MQEAVHTHIAHEKEDKWIEGVAECSIMCALFTVGFRSCTRVRFVQTGVEQCVNKDEKVRGEGVRVQQVRLRQIRLEVKHDHRVSEHADRTERIDVIVQQLVCVPG